MTVVESRYAAAQRSDEVVVLEGVHAVKHALRFGAEVRDLTTAEPERLQELLAEVAPDLAPLIESSVTVVPPEVFARLGRRAPGSPLLGIAAVPADVPPVPPGLAVVLWQPRHAGNTGAVIRVAAAAQAAAVLVTGSMPVWSPQVVRAAAGLHFALPVANVDWPVELGRPTVAFDPDHGDAQFRDIPSDAALVFGGEREGLPDDVLESVDRVVRIPMRTGVSSLNLATSVAVALYGAGR